MAKDTTRDDWTLDCWKEDVKTDSSVRFFEETEDDETFKKELVKESYKYHQSNFSNTFY
jgi:hypothetical protein